MKLLFGFVAIAFAQRNKPNKWAPTPTETTTTTKYTKPKTTKTTTTYSTTTKSTTTYSSTKTTPGKYSANQYGSYGYDDPHFSVQAPGQERLCFDFHPTGDISLLIDPESALSVTATTIARPSGRSYMHSVHFSSPLGAHLEFTIEGVTLAGLGDQIPTDPHPLTGHQEYGDISFLETYSKNGNHEHTRVNIKDGPTFEMVSTKTKGAFLVSVLDYTGISEKSQGVIGQFLRQDAYFIQDSGNFDEDGNSIGSIQADGMEFEVINKAYHREDSCWVISEKDVLHLMANL